MKFFCCKDNEKMATILQDATIKKTNLFKKLKKTDRIFLCETILHWQQLHYYYHLQYDFLGFY